MMKITARCSSNMSTASALGGEGFYLSAVLFNHTLYYSSKLKILVNGGLLAVAKIHLMCTFKRLLYAILLMMMMMI